MVRYGKEKEAAVFAETAAKSPTAIECDAKKWAKGTLRCSFQAHSTTKPAPKLKSVGVQPLGFGKGWSLPQERNSASKSQKFADIKRNKTNSHNTERTKAANKKKPHAEKKSRPS